ncbi:MAG: hypothetical protein K1X91_04965 [Bacteriodetes bacterium]|nr:hypothetical protein [Bacteroidota bacterium]
MIKILQYISTFILCVAILHSNVNVKNGNFFIGYVDVYFNDNFKIERVYNSKTDFKGMFGRGWGCEYEMYLTTLPDGTIMLHEYGGGAENIFKPRGYSPISVTNAVNNIVELEIQYGITQPEQRLNRMSSLQDNSNRRTDAWKALLKKGVKWFEIATGTVLTSYDFSAQKILVTDTSYNRINGDITEVFNKKGQFVKRIVKDGSYIVLEYDANGRISRMSNDKMNTLKFHYNSIGLVSKIISNSTTKSGAFKQSSYTYDTLQYELIESNDAGNNIFKYSYSKDGYHNLVQILYQDNTTMQIGYWGAEKFVNVKSAKERDGRYYEYDYILRKKVDEINQNYTVTVSVYLDTTKTNEISNSTYLYIYRTSSSGREWTYSLKSIIDGDTTETRYHEKTGLPVFIAKHGDTTKFDYTPKGDVTYKETSYSIKWIDYSSCNKVSRVKETEKYSRKPDTTWSTFEYDSLCNLTMAKNSDGKLLSLKYDNKGHITTLLDEENNQTITFEYNQINKPISITVIGVGTIKVIYNTDNEIEKVDSDGGRTVATKVTRIFQNLLDVIRPAGVSLNF